MGSEETRILVTRLCSPYGSLIGKVQVSYCLVVSSISIKLSDGTTGLRTPNLLAAKESVVTTSRRSRHVLLEQMELGNDNQRYCNGIKFKTTANLTMFIMSIIITTPRRR